MFRFQDASAVAGARYGYRLAWEVDGRTQHSPENWVTVPAAPGVATFDVAPNPARGACRVRFALAAGSHARLDVCDIAGRRVLSRECIAGSAETAAALPTASLAPGVYLVRLTQGRTVLTRRVALLN